MKQRLPYTGFLEVLLRIDMRAFLIRMAVAFRNRKLIDQSGNFCRLPNGLIGNKFRQVTDTPPEPGFRFRFAHFIINRSIECLDFGQFGDQLKFDFSRERYFRNWKVTHELAEYIYDRFAFSTGIFIPAIRAPILFLSFSRSINASSEKNLLCMLCATALSR
ncbi:MAG: hypothetical protein EPGJADBJ_04877 [Saprospiraceae bacterium]|nr:hypothetical protein [Saprospiraceae bacterium]